MQKFLNLTQECANCKNNSYFYKKNKGNVVGLYCNVCGRFLKWANRSEKNLIFLSENSQYGTGGANAD